MQDSPHCSPSYETNLVTALREGTCDLRQQDEQAEETNFRQLLELILAQYEAVL